MPNYAKINGDTILEFPSYPQRDHPNTSFGEGWQGEIDGVEYVIVEYVPYENTDPNKQVVYDELPQVIDGTWKLNYSLVNISLEQAKQNKLQSIDSEWAELEKTGWDTGLPQGHLGITPSDVALISGSFALAKEAANLGLPLPSLVTIENNELSFNSITEMLQLMLLYGQSRSQMSMEIASKRKAVENALTIEEVEAI
jgi:hypothetical protein